MNMQIQLFTLNVQGLAVREKQHFKTDKWCMFPCREKSNKSLTCIKNL